MSLCDGTWAVFPSVAAKRLVPLSSISAPSCPLWTDPGARVAYQRYMGKPPCSPGEYLNPFRGAGVDYAGCSTQEWNMMEKCRSGLVVSFVTPSFLRRSFGAWLTRGNRKERRTAVHTLEKAEFLPCFERQKMPIAAYLLGHAENQEQAAHGVLAASVMAMGDSSHPRPWFAGGGPPMGMLALCPPELAQGKARPGSAAAAASGGEPPSRGSRRGPREVEHGPARPPRERGGWRPGVASSSKP